MKLQEVEGIKKDDQKLKANDDKIKKKKKKRTRR